MPDFRRLICCEQVGHGSQSYYPWKDKHCQYRPKCPHVFPFPAIHETGWRGETSVEYACTQRQCCSARGCDKENCGCHHCGLRSRRETYIVPRATLCQSKTDRECFFLRYLSSYLSSEIHK